MRDMIMFILMITCTLTCIGCAIAQTIFRFQHLDFSTYRALVENPIPCILGIISAGVAYIALGAIKRS